MYLAVGSLLFATNVVVGYALPQAEAGFVVCMTALGDMAHRAQRAFLDAESGLDGPT